MEPPPTEQPAEQSRSFKRRLRRKKQLERRRRADGGPAGSSDEHEPGAGEPRPAAQAAGTEEQGRDTEQDQTRHENTETATTAHRRSGKGRPRRSSRPEREDGAVKVGPATVCAAVAAAIPTETAVRHSAELSESDRLCDTPAAQAEHLTNSLCQNQSESQSTGVDAAERRKSSSHKRRKRKSTGPSAAVPECPPSEPAPSAADLSAVPPEAAERVSPPRAAVADSSKAVEPPARRREASPVVSSTEEVLRSIRALQSVLSGLRAGLLAAPPPAPKTSAVAPPAPKTSAVVPPAPKTSAVAPSAPKTSTVAPSAPKTSTAPPPPVKTFAAPPPSPDTFAARPMPPTPTPPAPTAAPAKSPPPPAATASASAMAPPSDASAGEQAPQKTKEQIKAERKAKAEAAKLAKAAKASQKKQQQQQKQQAAGDGTSDAAASGDKPTPKADKPSGAATGIPEKPAAVAEKPQPAGVKTEKPAGVKAEKPAGGEAPEKPKTGEKSKAELKAERRAKQEAQRAAKAAAAASAAPKGATTASSKAAAPAAKSGKTAAAGGQSASDQKEEESGSKSERRSAKKTAEKTASKKGLQMFSHLLPFDAGRGEALAANKHGVHPALIPFVLRLSAGRLSGSNAGAVALLTSLADLVDQYVTPAQRELRRDLPDLVHRSVGQLAHCRPLSVAMENVAHRLEHVIRHDVPADKGDYEAKQYIIDWIERYIQDNICKAMSAITIYAGEKIKDGDVILTYGRSTAVLDVLSSAWSEGRRFRAVVVDSRPRLDGRDMLRQLLDAGVPCSYGLLTGISHLMKEATKVLLGASALLSNGMVLSRAGTALVSLTGRALNRPVLVCCETYKFSDRVQTDSQVYNQLGDPDELITSPASPLSNWRDSDSLSLLNLTYDVTPPELVDVVVTELGAIPCTSVPAVLRLQQAAVQAAVY